MNSKITETIENIQKEFSNLISKNARNYVEVSIGKKAKALGFDDLAQCYPHTSVIVPIKDPVPGMKVRIDGRGFSGYVQFDSGIAVPSFLARETGLPFSQYIPNDSMILNVH